MGADVLAKSNKVHYSGQDGFMVLGSKTRAPKLINNFVVGSAQNGIWLMRGVSGAEIRDNKIILSYYGIKNDGKDTAVTENQIERFFQAVETTESAIIAQNVFKSGRNGVSITKGVEKAVVEKNEFSYLCIGMIVKENVKTLISKNKFIYVGQPVRVYSSKRIEISKNEFLHHAYLGVDAENCSEMKLSGNFFSDATTRSIRISGGSDNTVSKNEISDVQSQFMGGGLLLTDTKNNTIEDNEFERCSIAVRFDGAASTGNIVRDNKFEATKKKVFFAGKHSDTLLPPEKKRKLLEANTIEFK